MTYTPPPDVKIQSVRKSIFERMSIVWIVPILALVIALSIAWQSYTSLGPLIEIEFESGTGIAAGETEVKFRDVTVGKVEKIRFSEALDAVIAEVRLDKDIAPYVDDSAKFWIVRPEVTTRGISGLGTVLSGVFIEGSWDSTPADEMVFYHNGLDYAPLIRAGRDGLQIAFKSGPDTTLTDNAPIIFRGIEVGKLGRAQIVPSGEFAISEALIYQEFRHLISANTRFWDISGVSFRVGASGAEIDVESLASLLSGGLTFQTIVSGGAPAQDGQLFEVYESAAAARSSVFQGADVETLDLTVIFEDNVAGLTVDAPIELNGLKIGEVTNIAGVVDRATFGDNRVRLNASLSIQPSRLGLVGEATRNNALAFLRQRVSNGLRARLASGSLLTGGLKVELAVIEGAEPAEIDPQATPFPTFPAVASNVSDVTATAEGVLKRINNLPVEELMQSAVDFLNSATAFVTDDDLRGTPQDVRGLIGDMRGLVGSPEIQSVPVQLSSALAQIERFLAQLEEQQAAAKLAAALEATVDAANGVNIAVEGVPDLIASLDGVAQKARSLDIEPLVATANEVLESANALVSSEDTAQLPADLSAALAQISAALAELREGGAITNTNAALASARGAADALAASSQDLPALVQRMTRVLNQASDTLKGFDETSKLNRNAQEALRDIQKAADAVANLARTIQRNPNSLLLGR